MHEYKLNSDEIEVAAGLLAKLELGYVPEPLFDQLTRLMVCSTIVIVPLKQTPQGWQVLLCKRGGAGPGNRTWPDHWHLPGTMLRPSDKEGDFSDAFDRLLKGEIGSTVSSRSLHFIRTAFTETKRGRELNQLYYVLITKDEPLNGTFFPVDNLPTPIIEHEIAFIKEAAASVA